KTPIQDEPVLRDGGAAPDHGYSQVGLRVDPMSAGDGDGVRRTARLPAHREAGGQGFPEEHAPATTWARTLGPWTATCPPIRRSDQSANARLHAHAAERPCGRPVRVAPRRWSASNSVRSDPSPRRSAIPNAH